MRRARPHRRLPPPTRAKHRSASRSAPRSGSCRSGELCRLRQTLPSSARRKPGSRATARALVLGSRFRAGLSGERNAVANLLPMTLFHRHGRACPGHPRLSWVCSKTWMPGTGPGMTTVRCTTHRADSSEGLSKISPDSPARKREARGERRVVALGPRFRGDDGMNLIYLTRNPSEAVGRPEAGLAVVARRAGVKRDGDTVERAGEAD